MTRAPMKTKLKRRYERIFCCGTDGPTGGRAAMQKVDALARRLKLEEQAPIEDLFFRSFNAVGHSMRRAMEKGFGGGFQEQRRQAPEA